MKITRQIGWIFLLLLLFSASAAEGEQLRIIDLKHRTAAEIIRVVQPLLGPEDTISGKAYVVFLTAAPENLARIESIIRRLDKPSRQLLIIVVQGEDAREALGSIDISGNLSIGDNTRVEFGRNPQQKDSVSITGRGDRSAQRNVDIQKIKTREGSAAVIYVGQSIPVSLQSVAPRPQGNLSDGSVVFKEVRTGFRVLPRLSGNHYVLDITSQRESTLTAGRGAVESQQIQTQVQGRLNQWLDIGGVLGVRQLRSTGLVYDDRTGKQSRGGVYLKVVEDSR